MRVYTNVKWPQVEPPCTSEWFNKEFKQKRVGDGNDREGKNSSRISHQKRQLCTGYHTYAVIARLRRENLGPNARFTKDVNRH